MNIWVCLKQTFDTEEKIKLVNGQVVEDQANWVINPYDEYAVEEALKLREQFGGDVTVISVGPARVETALRHALAMGADQAVVISGVEGDEYVVSKALAHYLKDKEIDMILTGNQSVDNGAGQVGVRLAEQLKIPYVTSVVKLTVEQNQVQLERDVEGDIYQIEGQLPLLLTCQQGLNNPRYPSLPNIMKSKKKAIHTIPSDAFAGMDQNAKTETVDRYLPPQRKACQFVHEGDSSGSARALVSILFDKAVIY
ncbi:electron transfer flavoprotein subunit beta/FixA family protein [Paenibacillus validus]|uniref:Electron transfer flavoprotein subunit beta n=1 Tax=Paenibacillus validus TaxID=44253 RepID=A0A7X3CRC9_9BACL|nr:MULTISPECIES: electron transfer flavoprotein subunit beta/FixA family protein [Paenibacillus]MED4599282.1 electron transfer flavoprotein subunit beta/FixA family protein [Paenibacillus validus]MED4606406.1 electron transfer flavoprotein subunit beta/FixA family protein [Paenibacillus validus]MUG70072.1 electron transfer flavoprotein subunit beta [Paenibacillus validus]